MDTKITYICENSAMLSTGLTAEHGLAVLIEADETALFDTGQGLGLIKNLELLGKNIRDIDKVIISHGHHDHVGGLMDLLRKRNNNVNIYLNPDALKEKIAVFKDGQRQEMHSIGWPHSEKEYEQNGAVFMPVKGMAKVSDTIYTFSNIKRDANWKSRDERLKRKDNGSVIDDPFDDDLSLLIETKSGPVILLGCAHAGIVEILNEISSKTGYDEFHAVIGGTHLISASNEYIEDTINCIKNYNIKVLSAAHCTGFNAACTFSLVFKKAYVNAAVGVSFNF